ncbi:MAG: acyl-CoA thioesterase [Actinomycetota bacterium]|jgi:acyl-CoA thioesterase-2|nr:acyl-CoA thioesterase [Actinomycetota bacterium]HQZ85748.1 acyl-CoA thioesterase II [Actinomycetota bacterium]
MDVHKDPDEHFIERLSLERVDRDIFTGQCHAGAPLRAFGGQVAAQALIAAGRTVEEPDRAVHSLHGYFLRAGRTNDPIVYLVERVRDGRSFSTRRVKAIQYGETIFTMSASFAIDEPTLSHQAAAPDVPGPDEVPDFDLLDDDESGPRTRDQGFPAHALLQRKLVDTEVVAQATGGTATRVAWTRVTEKLPDDPLIHVCALTYFSDLTLIGAILEPHGGRAVHQELDLASLDHAMWFHAPFRADEWTMFVLDSPVASRGHGLARGEFYRADGTLIASVVQEALLRRRPT